MDRFEKAKTAKKRMKNTSMSEEAKVRHVDEAIVIVEGGQIFVVREKKGSVQNFGTWQQITGMLTETLLMSPISTNRRTHWDHLKYYPCTVALTQLLSHSLLSALSFVCFLRSATLAFVSFLVFPILPDQLQEKPNYRKIISLPSVPWAHCENTRLV